MLQRHWENPHPALQSVDIAFYAARERNAHGFEELSHRSAMVSTSIQWNWGDFTWSTGTTWQMTGFDASVFPDEPVRVDRSAGYDVSIEHTLSNRHTLRLEYNDVRSQSTSPIFDNHYQQVAVKLHRSW
jgi:hypothetical protein